MGACLRLSRTRRPSRNTWMEQTRHEVGGLCGPHSAVHCQRCDVPAIPRGIQNSEIVGKCGPKTRSPYIYRLTSSRTNPYI